ncbi:hypothetical protein RF11_07933 [Thelohanellus kitauei]|uniref:Uncharacterized protein n=1 Tax=Thelohanellus kitauei TaxID=669202 RepID=A0A0C2IZ17_THEKT|nr:hypothetical protein RF11_07933 [Thelohanellus kitauei]
MEDEDRYEKIAVKNFEVSALSEAEKTAKLWNILRFVNDTFFSKLLRLFYSTPCETGPYLNLISGFDSRIGVIRKDHIEIFDHTDLHCNKRLLVIEPIDIHSRIYHSDDLAIICIVKKSNITFYHLIFNDNQVIETFANQIELKMNIDQILIVKTGSRGIYDCITFNKKGDVLFHVIDINTQFPIVFERILDFNFPAGYKEFQRISADKFLLISSPQKSSCYFDKLGIMIYRYSTNDRVFEPIQLCECDDEKVPNFPNLKIIKNLTVDSNYITFFENYKICRFKITNCTIWNSFDINLADIKNVLWIDDNSVMMQTGDVLNFVNFTSESPIIQIKDLSLLSQQYNKNFFAISSSKYHFSLVYLRYINEEEICMKLLGKHDLESVLKYAKIHKINPEIIYKHKWNNSSKSISDLGFFEEINDEKYIFDCLFDQDISLLVFEKILKKYKKITHKTDDIYHSIILQFQQRIEIFKMINDNNIFPIECYRSFLTCSIFHLVNELLSRELLPAASILFRYYDRILKNHYYALLCTIPEVTPVSKMSRILSIFDDNFEPKIHSPDSKILNNCQFDEKIENDVIQHFYTENPHLLRFRDRLDAQATSDWYIFRACEIYENSNIIWNAFQLLLHGVHKNVQIPKCIIDDSSFLFETYQCSNHISLRKFIDMSKTEKFFYLLETDSQDCLIDSFLLFYKIDTILIDIIWKLPPDQIRNIVKNHVKYSIESHILVNAIYDLFQRDPAKDLEILKALTQSVIKNQLPADEQTKLTQLHVYHRILSILQEWNLYVPIHHFDDIFNTRKNQNIFNNIFASLKVENFNQEFTILELMSCIIQITTADSILYLKNFVSNAVYKCSTIYEVALVYDIFERGFEINNLPLIELSQILTECTEGLIDLIRGYNDEYYLLANKCAELSHNSKYIDMFSECKKLFKIIPNYDLKKIFKFQGNELLDAYIKRGDIISNISKIIESYSVLSGQTATESEIYVIVRILDHYFEASNYAVCADYCQRLINLKYERSWYYCFHLALKDKNLKVYQRLKYLNQAITNCPKMELNSVLSEIKKFQNRHNQDFIFEINQNFSTVHIERNAVFYIDQEKLLQVCVNSAKNLVQVNKLAYSYILRYLYDVQISIDLEFIKDLLSLNPMILISFFEKFLNHDNFPTFIECKNRILTYNKAKAIAPDVDESIIIKTHPDQSKKNAVSAVLDRLTELSMNEHGTRRLHDILFSETFIQNLLHMNIEHDLLASHIRGILSQFSSGQASILLEWFLFGQELFGPNFMYKNIRTSQHIANIELVKDYWPELDYNSLLAGDLAFLEGSAHKSNFQTIYKFMSMDSGIEFDKQAAYMILTRKVINFDENDLFLNEEFSKTLKNLLNELEPENIEKLITYSLSQPYSLKKLATLSDFLARNLPDSITNHQALFDSLKNLHRFYVSCSQYEEQEKCKLVSFKHPRLNGVEEIYNILKQSDLESKTLCFLAKVYANFINKVFPSQFFDFFQCQFEILVTDTESMIFLIGNLRKLEFNECFKTILSSLTNYLYNFYLHQDLIQMSGEGLRIITFVKEKTSSIEFQKLEEFYSIQMCLRTFWTSDMPINLDIDSIQSSHTRLELIQFLILECRLPSHLVAISDLIQIFRNKTHDPSFHKVIRDFMILCVDKFRNGSIVSNLFMKMKPKHILDHYSCTEVYTRLWNNQLYFDAVRVSMAANLPNLMNLAIFDVSCLRDMILVEPVLNDSFINESYIVLDLVIVVYNLENKIFYHSLVKYCLNTPQFQHYDKSLTDGSSPFHLLIEKLQNADLQDEVRRLQRHPKEPTHLLSSVMDNLVNFGKQFR